MSGTLPRIAVVTGADSGIGRATALLLASEGFDIGLTVHEDEEGARRTASDVEERGQRCAMEPFDAASPTAGETVDRLADRLGGIGVLVNVAGTGTSSPVMLLDLADWNSTLATDLTGPFLCARHAARRMVAQGQGGRIVNVTSVHEHVPRLGSAAYCAAKAGLGMLTKVLALELAEHGITVNAVAPGEIATEMTGQDEEDAWRTERRGNPLGRPGHVNEVASVIGFLASPRATYVTGSSYAVDGGLMLMSAHGHDDADAGWRTV
ncbi:SDR family oxidoreductase [Terrabacter sp. NPDC080008]|uniref:SDR family oxidoreductase n=1 Tax=Terrabacter sp. NPDC080008 TaxID=3155176 RepID=UPI00344BF60C